MQFHRMRVLLVPLLAFVGASFAVTAAADVVIRSRAEWDLKARASKARSSTRLVTSADSDPDTVWLGHVSATAGAPGTVGGYGPFHIGRGPRRIVGGIQGTAAAYDGVWSFDHFQAGEVDSLQGWWPIQPAHSSVGPSDLDDSARPWFGLDAGNLANYVPPQGSPKRTFGVTGIWHADNGTLLSSTVPGTNPVAPGWAPINGVGKSAWCGIRSHGDLTAVDVTGTGNPINDNLTQFNGENSGAQFGSLRTEGTDHNFPGYGGQWDQSMYRDVTLPANLTAGQTLTVGFKYTTNMSTGYDQAHRSQVGYFYFDPIKTSAAGDGNFISAAGSLAGPCDSFMVYIGAPVNDAAAVLSDGLATSVYDSQRRWFSEIIKTTNLAGAPGSGPYRQLVTATGATGTPAAPIVFSQALSDAVVNPILDADGGAGNGGRVRIVFRVKTNRGYDDETNGSQAFSSAGRGAAIIDDVALTGPSGTLLSDGFEGANGGFNNDIVASPSSFWKSTGKPPPIWFHVHDLDAGLPYDDPCGAITAAVRLCNMGNNVLVPGNHDDSERPGGLFGTNFQDALKWAVSPTINLVSSGVGVYNGMGIDAEIAARGSLLLAADMLLNLYGYTDPPTGNGFRFGWQSWPATQPNGVKCWGEMRKSGFFNATGGVRGCGGFGLLQSEAYSEQLILTSNPSGKPDSVRAYIESMSRCFTLPITALTCSPTGGTNAGGYFDNMSIGLAAAPTPPGIAIDFARGFNDCFPVNNLNRPVTPFGPASDTLAAHIRTGFNEAPSTGDPSDRENIPGDSTIVFGAGANVRVDMIFRILPGVGNYVTIGNRASNVARRPDVSPRVRALAADATSGLAPVEKFWGAYMANNGAFGTGGNGTTGPGHAGSVWDPNRWNSARLDTVEVNYFPITGIANSAATDALTLGSYMTTYHESDPKYAVLGIVKNRCFLNNTAGNIDHTTTNCGAVGGAFVNYPPAGVGSEPDYQGNPASGLNETELTGAACAPFTSPCPGKTREFTKIIPDGQLTPGAHVQYFFRKSTVGGPLATFEMAPDTNFILPNTQNVFGYFDGARWSEVSVLPDRWKEVGFAPGATGMACILVIDYADRRGDEISWVAVADSIGLTVPNKRGAHNGWRATPNDDITANVGGNDAICRRDNGGQAGTMWDLYEVLAGESNIQAGRPGSRGAVRNTSPGSVSSGHWATHGPSEAMAANYPMIINLMSDIGPDAIGPIDNQTDNDIGLFTSYLALAPAPPIPPRGLMFMGYDVGEAFEEHHSGFMRGHLRARLSSNNYRQQSGNSNDRIDLSVSDPVAPTGGYIYGVGNQCVIDLDVLLAETAAPAGQEVSFYAGNVNFGAAVFATNVTGSRNYRTLINGWTLGLFGGGFGSRFELANAGKRKYLGDLLSLANAFGAMTTCGALSVPVGIGDNPNGTGSAFLNFLNLKSSNPMKSGQARIAFGLAKSEKVEVRMYDVSGRQIKTVANRVFAAGQEHVVIWDGTNEMGQRVKSGVYFYQLRTPSWTSQKKLAVLAN